MLEEYRHVECPKQNAIEFTIYPNCIYWSEIVVNAQLIKLLPGRICLSRELLPRKRIFLLIFQMFL